MENFNILGIHWKTQFLEEGGKVMKNQYIRGGELPNKGRMDSFQI